MSMPSPPLPRPPLASMSMQPGPCLRPRLQPPPRPRLSCPGSDPTGHLQTRRARAYPTAYPGCLVCPARSHLNPAVLSLQQSPSIASAPVLQLHCPAELTRPILPSIRPAAAPLHFPNLATHADFSPPPLMSLDLALLLPPTSRLLCHASPQRTRPWSKNRARAG